MEPPSFASRDGHSYRSWDMSDPAVTGSGSDVFTPLSSARSLFLGGHSGDSYPVGRFGGKNSFPFRRPGKVSSLPLGNHAWECYLLSLALACFSLGANLLINKQKLGFQLRMIQEDEATAQSVGIPVFSSKIKAYLLGATIALLAGGIYVRQVGYIGPSSAFGLPVAMPPVIMALIGGGQRWWGPLLGAIILTGLQEILWTGLDRWVLSGYGMVLILFGIFWSGFDQGKKMRRVVHK